MRVRRCCRVKSFNLLRGDGSSTIKGENKISKRFLSWQHGKSSSSSYLKLVALASSASGTSVEYSGNPSAISVLFRELLDARKKEKRKMIAGIEQNELFIFGSFKGVHIRHKVYDVASQVCDSSETASHSQLPHIPTNLLHGFGASVFSWSRDMKCLARLTGSRILAIDRPAFGLILRVKSVELSSGSKDEKPLNPYAMAFSLLATLQYKREDKSSGLDAAGIPFSRIFRFLSQTINYISEVLVQMVKGMGDMLSTLSKKLLSTFLRSAFAVMLRNAWLDPNKTNENALRSKYWDRDLLEKTTAMLLDANTESKPPLAERLHEIPCPVLIVMGDDDLLVPSWNTERLSQAIPGSCLEVVKQCGHLPLEEKVEFVSAVDKFLQRAFGGSLEQQILQAASQYSYSCRRPFLLLQADIMHLPRKSWSSKCFKHSCFRIQMIGNYFGIFT
ncbi:hypothetical protein ACJRO7_028392 [Eucalyptus globulus]|uniref:AB hydrolase-1 domain-containing protein n=1 Tax=Eucalyptus globulus TaxID=34317 RepID=A0ABD3JVK8_EUCGL